MTSACSAARSRASRVAFVSVLTLVALAACQTRDHDGRTDPGGSEIESDQARRDAYATGPTVMPEPAPEVKTSSKPSLLRPLDDCSYYPVIPPTNFPPRTVACGQSAAVVDSACWDAVALNQRIGSLTRPVSYVCDEWWGPLCQKTLAAPSQKDCCYARNLCGLYVERCIQDTARTCAETPPAAKSSAAPLERSTRGDRL